MLEEVENREGERVLFLLFIYVVYLPFLVFRQYIDGKADRRVTELSLEQRCRFNCLLRSVTDQVRQDVENHRKNELSLACTNVLR